MGMANKCEVCTEKCPQAERAHQAALGRMYATKEFVTLLKKVESGELVEVVRITTETLTGIPSIVYGLFGMLFFVNKLQWRLSIMAGAATLAIMVLPVIMRTTEEALIVVPDSYREGSFGLGAGKLRTVFQIVLPRCVEVVACVHWITLLNEDLTRTPYHEFYSKSWQKRK